MSFFGYTTRLINKRLLLAVLLIAFFGIVFGFKSDPSEATPAPASYFPEIKKTGVNSSNNKRPNSDHGLEDNYWYMKRIFNDAGRRTCQANNNSRPIVLVEEFNVAGILKAGTTDDGIHPWATSSAGRWISLNDSGLHEGNGTGNLPPAGDPNYCYDSSYTGFPGHRPEHTKHWNAPNAPDLQFQDDSNNDRWNTYVYSYKYIDSSPLMIDSRVDMQSVKLTMRGIADNYIGVRINGVPLQMEGCPYPLVSTGGSVYPDPVKICGYGFNDPNQQFTASVAPGTNPFPDGKIYSIEILVKSTRSNIGLLLSDVRLEGELKNKPPDGAIDVVSCDSIEGWARDPNHTDQSVHIQIFQDAHPAFGGRLVADIQADYPRNDVGNHGFIVDVSEWKDAYDHTYYVYAYDIDDPTTGSWLGSSGTPVTLGPCAPPDCDSFSVNTANGYPQPGETFDAAASITYNKGDEGFPVTYDLILDIVSDPNNPGSGVLDAGNTDSPDLEAPPDYSYNFSGLRIDDPPDQYFATYRIRWSNHHFPDREKTNKVYSVLCNSPDNTVTIGNKPYLKFYGNDVFAGSAFDNDLDGEGCPVAADSGIYTWQDKLPNSDFRYPGEWVGSSVEYAAFALGDIGENSNDANKFYTNGLRRGYTLPTNDSTGASFGNWDDSGASKEIIGQFGGGSRCIPNYYENHPSTSNGNGPVSITPLVSGKKWYGNGINPVEINGGSIGGIVNPNQDLTVYVNGDALITDNIITEKYQGIDHIPSFYLVASGNIYIDYNVTRLDGVFITQNLISTCSNGAQPPNNNLLRLDSPCGTSEKGTLLINGAFIAGEVNFNRANGTLRQSIVNEQLSSSNAAEKFNFTPELYIAQPNGIEIPGENSTKYDFITSLPPIL